MPGRGMSASIQILLLINHVSPESLTLDDRRLVFHYEIMPSMCPLSDRVGWSRLDPRCPSNFVCSYRTFIGRSNMSARGRMFWGSGGAGL